MTKPLEPLDALLDLRKQGYLLSAECQDELLAEVRVLREKLKTAESNLTDEGYWRGRERAEYVCELNGQVEDLKKAVAAGFSRQEVRDAIEAAYDYGSSCGVDYASSLPQRFPSQDEHDTVFEAIIERLVKDRKP